MLSSKFLLLALALCVVSMSPVSATMRGRNYRQLDEDPEPAVEPIDGVNGEYGIDENGDERFFWWFGNKKKKPTRKPTRAPVRTNAPTKKKRKKRKKKKKPTPFPTPQGGVVCVDSTEDYRNPRKNPSNCAEVAAKKPSIIKKQCKKREVAYACPVTCKAFGCDGSDPVTSAPTNAPTNAPTSAPTNAPTNAPTKEPTEEPTDFPTFNPTEADPTESPTQTPTFFPTFSPTESIPTDNPTQTPTFIPTEDTKTEGPSSTKTTDEPTGVVSTGFPTPAPSEAFTLAPTLPFPTANPTEQPSDAPSPFVSIPCVDSTADIQGQPNNVRTCQKIRNRDQNNPGTIDNQCSKKENVRIACPVLCEVGGCGSPPTNAPGNDNDSDGDPAPTDAPVNDNDSDGDPAPTDAPDFGLGCYTIGGFSCSCGPTECNKELCEAANPPGPCFNPGCKVWIEPGNQGPNQPSTGCSEATRCEEVCESPPSDNDNDGDPAPDSEAPSDAPKNDDNDSD